MYALAIHGGAGTLPRNELSTAMERQYRDALGAALEAGCKTSRAGRRRAWMR